VWPLGKLLLKQNTGHDRHVVFHLRKRNFATDDLLRLSSVTRWCDEIFEQRTSIV
jgi:hypothetical protein